MSMFKGTEVRVRFILELNIVQFSMAGIQTVRGSLPQNTQRVEQGQIVRTAWPYRACE